jgi:hypothetical protein
VKLILDTREIDCVARWCDTPQDEGVFWRFISEQGKVWRVCMLDLPGTRPLGSIDSAVTVKSLLFPVADLIRCVGRYDETGSKKEIIRLFLTNLLMQFDSDFASRGGECGRMRSNELLPGVPHARRRKIGMGRNVPNEILESVLKLVLGTDTNPNIKQCSDLLADIERVLRDGRLFPAVHNWGDLSFVVKRLATRFTCFAPDNLERCRLIENELIYQCRLFTGKVDLPGKVEAGDEDFLAFLERFNCVALYTVMGDTRVLPVYRFDTEPHEMNGEDLKLYGGVVEVGKRTASKETAPPVLPIQKPCNWCHWSHNDELTIWRQGKSEIAKFRAGRKGEPVTVQVLRCLHDALKEGKTEVTATHLANVTGYDGHVRDAFKHHAKAYELLIHTKDGHINLKRPPSENMPEHLGEHMP